MALTPDEEANLLGAIRLENRLTKIEAAVLTVQGQVGVVEGLVRTQNGRVADHISSDAAWKSAHELNHAKAMSYSRGVVGALLAAAALIGFLVSTFSYPVARLIFG